MRTVLLVGIGHTHAHILRNWARQPPADAHLVCISPYAVAAYSGMLPGTLARQYNLSQMLFPLEPLCRQAGAELHVAAAVGVDANRRQVELADGRQFSYDVLSLGIGSVPNRRGVDIAADSVAEVKPMQTLLDRLDTRLAAVAKAVRQEQRPLRIAVIGAGAAGVEIAFCLDRRLQLDFPELARRIDLFDGSDTVLSNETRATQRRATHLLSRRGVGLHLGEKVVAVTTEAVRREGGEECAADVVIWAAGAAPPPLLETVNLPKDERGFLLTRRTLQSTGDDRVFVVGDSGTIERENCPKAGVYAVREGPILWKNLQVVLGGGRLRSYHPQPGFLRLFNTADERAIINYYGLTMHGRWCWWLKDWIDRRFVAQYDVKQLPSP